VAQNWPRGNKLYSVSSDFFFPKLRQVLAADKRDALDDRKSMLPEEKANATDLAVLWDFEGVLRYSPMFYGFYSNRARQPSGYRLPFAYFMTSLAVYIYSFVATLRRYMNQSLSPPTSYIYHKKLTSLAQPNSYSSGQEQFVY